MTNTAADADFANISTGRLPDEKTLTHILHDAYEDAKTDNRGDNSQVYPALARMPRDLFGLCLASVSGDIHAKGDADHEFSIMSVSKPFIFALICELIGPAQARAKLGANATGRAFNSLAAIEAMPRGLTNPMVNAGAIAATSLAPGASEDEKWRFIHDGLSRFAGRALAINDEVYASATATNFRNRAIAWTLESVGAIHGDPLEAVALYTRQCSLNVSSRDLAIMGATLADGGVNPVTGLRVVGASVCHYTLAVMATAGLYETSGDWLYEVGLPGKSGIGGGIVTVSPGKGAIGAFAPPLDQAGNSVKAQRATRFLSQKLGLDLFVSAPAEAR